MGNFRGILVADDALRWVAILRNRMYKDDALQYVQPPRRKVQMDGGQGLRIEGKLP
jgi:hypothetical protein